MHFSSIAFIVGFVTWTASAQQPPANCPTELSKRPACDSCGGGVNTPHCTFGDNKGCICNIATPTGPDGVQCEIQDPPSDSQASIDATIDAGLQLLTFFYNSHNEGVIHIPAGDQRFVEKTSGYNHASHVAFQRSDTNENVPEETIDISDVASAILKISSSCMKGKVPVGSGKWIVTTNWETGSRVSKKRHARDFAGHPSSLQVRDVSSKNNLVARQNSKDREASLQIIAGYTLYRLTLASVNAYFGSQVVGWNDDEKKDIDGVAELAAKQVQTNGDANEINVRGPTKVYGIYLNLNGYGAWQDAASDIQQHGDISVILKTMAEAAMKDAADHKSIAGAYDYVIHDPDVNDPFGKSIGMVVRRLRVAEQGQAPGNPTEVCRMPHDFTEKRDLSVKRTIGGSYDTTIEGSDDHDPSVGFMIESLLNNNFRYLYHRLVRTWRNNQDQSRDDGIVEYAWMVGADPTTAEGNRQYQAQHPLGTIFFVMHLHFNAFVTPADGGSDLIPQVTAVNFFHATTVDRGAPQTPRVDGRQRGGGQLNERLTTFTCEETGHNWYPGDTAREDPHDEPLLNEFGRWLRSHWLVNGGNGGTLNPVRGAQNANGYDVNWRAPPLGDGQGSAEGPSIDGNGHNWVPDRTM